MGIFSGIKAVLTGVKSADKAMDIATKGTDGIIAGIDKMFFTDEEKSEASLATTKLAIDMVKATHGESTVRSVTRRWLAWLVMGNFCFLITLGALLWKVDNGWAVHILACAGLLSNLALAVGIFYFGYYGVKAIIGKSKDS